MIYVYDMVMNEKRVTSFKRYGLKYKLEKKFVMGNRLFYSFVSPGAEKILVVPTFAEQYEELKTMLGKFLEKNPGKLEYEPCRDFVQKKVSRTITEEDYPTEESASGYLKAIGVDYKDIRVTFEYLNDTLRIGTEFEIRDNNIFGNGIIVQMNINMEE